VSGRLTIRNKSRFDTAEVLALVKFATIEVDMRAVCVNVRNLRSPGWAGMAYEGVPSVSNANPTAEYLITLRVGPPEHFPMRPARPMRRGEPDYVLADWREAMVFLAAHEAKHIEQYKEDKPRSEVACNNFANYMLGRFRDEVGA
jgi:hypothetical protein